MGGGKFDPFFTTVYVDDYLLTRVHHSDDDTSALTAWASLASHHVRLIGPGETGATPILAPIKSTDWNTTIDALGFTINSNTMRISMTREKNEAIARLLRDHWPGSRRHARARDVLSMAGKLWSLAYVVRGKYSCGDCCGSPGSKTSGILEIIIACISAGSFTPTCSFGSGRYITSYWKFREGS